MEYQKLLFASEIRRLAVELRAEAKEKYLKESGLAGDDLRIAAMGWEGEYKIMSFVARAVAEISAIAEQIEPIETPTTNVEVRWT